MTHGPVLLLNRTFKDGKAVDYRKFSNGMQYLCGKYIDRLALSVNLKKQSK